MFKSISLGLIILMLSISTGSTQIMQVYTSDGETESFNLTDIDSIKFAEGPEGRQPGDEQWFSLTDEDSVLMVWIPPGEFMMGAVDDEVGGRSLERPRHRVTFENGFWIGKYEITQAQWIAVMGSNPAREYGVGDNYPVYNVSWEDIQAFEREVDRVYRLPSEAEWEYASRAGTETRFYWGDDPDYDWMHDYAVFRGNHNGHAEEVGTKEPNGWGLYDMSGNVAEWCEDRWHVNYEGAPDNGAPWLENPDNDEDRILRSSFWDNSSGKCRSAYRVNLVQDAQTYVYGFRLVRDAE